MLVYGKNVVKELLNNNSKINKAYIYQDFNDKDLIIGLQKQKISIKYVSKYDLDKLESGNHQGIIVDVPDYQYTSLDKLLSSVSDKSFFVILDHLEDPHNLGAIIRTCEAAGVDGIIIPKDRGVDVNSTVMKVSAGALTNISICSVANLVNTIQKLKEKGIWIVGTDMEDSSIYTDIDYNTPIALVIGSEGKGISRLVKETCDFIVHIPMYGNINSLNASVAAGIVIYEVIRQRRK